MASEAEGNLGRTNWLHTYLEDGWQILPSLKLDIGLRYEYNQNVTDENNNMAVVNTLVPGGEFVIASNNQGQISPPIRSAAEYSDSLYHVRAGRMGSQLTSAARCDWRRELESPGDCRTKKR